MTQIQNQLRQEQVQSYNHRIVNLLKTKGLEQVPRSDLPDELKEYLDHGEFIVAETYASLRGRRSNKVYSNGSYQPSEIYKTSSDGKWLIDPEVGYESGVWFLTAVVLMIHGNGQITTFSYWKTIMRHNDHVRTMNWGRVKDAIIEMLTCIRHA